MAEMKENKLVEHIRSHLVKIKGQEVRLRYDKYRRICLTDMCNAYGKQFYHYNELASTKNFIRKLEESDDIFVVGNHDNEKVPLIESFQGGNAKLQGTFGHSHIAMHLAMWLDAGFAINLLSSTTEYINQLNYKLDNFNTEYFMSQEKDRIDMIASMIDEETISDIATHNICYIRVMNKPYKVPGIDREVYVFKYGRTDNIIRRLNEHTRQYKDSTLLQLYIVANNTLIEREFTKYLKDNGVHLTMEIDGVMHKELFYTKPSLCISKIHAAFHKICLKAPVLTFCQLHIAKLETENIGLKHRLADKDRVIDILTR